MTSSVRALAAAGALVIIGAAGAASGQAVSAAPDLARTTELASEAGNGVTVADAFTPGPAEVPTAAAEAPRRPAYRNPWTTPRPSLRQAFSNMAASFRAEFQQTVPPPRSLAATPEGPEPALVPAHDIDFTVAEAFDPHRLAAPAASSHGVQAAAVTGERDDGVARARALNLAAAEKAKDAANAMAAHEAAQREYEKGLARWREQLDQ